MSNTFIFDEEFENRLIAFMIRDKEFFKKNSPLVKEEYFESQFRRDFYRLAKDYHEKYPNDDLPIDIMRNQVLQFYNMTSKHDISLEDYHAELQFFYDIDLDSNEQYVTDQLVYFAQRQEVKNVILDARDSVMSDGNLDDIPDKMAKALQTGQEIAETPQAPDLTYPMGAIQGWLKDFADLYSAHLESPYPFWIFNAAVCLGNVLSERVKLNTQLKPEPRLFSIGLGLSGDTRKSECGKQTIVFFNEYFKLQEKETLNEKGEKLPSKYFNTLWGCGSSEGLMDRLGHTPKLVLVYDELRSFVQKCDIKGSNLLQGVTTLFENNLLENATKDKYRRVDNCHLSLLGFCTVDTWTNLFSANFIDIGFINRLWIVPGDANRKNFLPKEISNLKKLGLMTRLTEVLKTFPEGQVTLIEMDEDAEDRMNQWYKSYERNDFTKRLESYGLRLLQIMAISEKKTEIDLDMVERVITLLEWQKRVREAYQPTEYTSVMAQIENLIRNVVKANPMIAEGRIKNKIRAKRFETWKVDKAFENLTKSGELKKIPGRTWKYVCQENG
jgi:hypothetical protein